MPSLLATQSNNQWGFEEAVFARTLCRIETFDCTVDAAPPARIRNRTRFHRACWGLHHRNGSVNLNISANGVSAQRPLTLGLYLDWPSLLRRAGLTTRPDFLKVDAEASDGAPFERRLQRLPHANKLAPQLDRSVDTHTTKPVGCVPRAGP